MIDDRARPVHVVIQEISDRRGRRRYMASVGGRVICDGSPNPLPCAAFNLLSRGYAASTIVVFQDAKLDFEECMTLAEAAELSDVVVPLISKGGRS